VGKRIVENEQAGQVRAAYGARSLEDLPERLTPNCGEGFSVQSLGNYRQFYLTFPTDEIRSTPGSELGWSHMKLLMRDEKDLEQGLLDQLQKLLLELGKGFAFAARQRHLRIENQDAFVDLVFDNRIHRCFVPIELKVGKLSHQDVGQLDMYVRVFDEQVRQTGDNPTIGLVLCSERNEAVVRYPSLTGSDQIFASRYQPWLPTEAELQAELALGRALMEIARSDTP
jgi:hypothetical protein